jgi:VanZ family protein
VRTISEGLESRSTVAARGLSAREYALPSLSTEPVEAPRRRTIRRAIGAALVLYWAALFIATHVRMPTMNELPTGSDKWMHFIAYTGLGGLLAAWLSARGASIRKLWLVVPAVCLAYAAADELLQQLVPTRSADILDGLADLAGAITGVAAVSVLRLLRSRRRAS